MQESINNWLSDKDFQSGLELLKKCSKNKILINNIERRKLESKLEYELKKFLGSSLISAPTPPPRNNKKKVVKGKVKFISLDVEALPEHLHQLYDETVLEINKIKQNHNAAKKADKTARVELISSLEKSRKMVSENYKILDAWKLDQLKGKEAINNDSKLLISSKEKNTYKKYISDGKKKLQDKHLSGAARVKLINAMQMRLSKLIASEVKFKEPNKSELEKLGLKFS